MAFPVWQPNRTYRPGDIVVPRTQPPHYSVSLADGNFEQGNTGWEYEGQAVYAPKTGDNGQNCVMLDYGRAAGIALNQSQLSVPPGKPLTVRGSIMIKKKGVGGGGNAIIRWYTAQHALIREDRGAFVAGGKQGWKEATVTAACPANAAYARAGFALSVANSNNRIYAGMLAVLTAAYPPPPPGLTFRAVQEKAAVSNAHEPTWPQTTGVQVIDGDVIWEALIASRITWKAEPLYLSADTESDWPQYVGGRVTDGTITWQAAARDINDPNCPHGPVVVIAASKVFCADGDIVRYSATVNPLDWSSDNDAGYLPTGLQNYGANPAAALGLYRSSVIAFNSEGFQLWQVDEDPAHMELLDALPLGSTHHHAIAPAANDLFFLTSQGVRSLAQSAASTSYQAGDVGMPIDPLIREAVAASDALSLGLYYPAMGQYWLLFNRDDECEAFVYGTSRPGQVGAWSRYVFPFPVDDWTIAGDVLYLASGNHIHRVDESLTGDEVEVNGQRQIVHFPGIVQWPWLDFGQPGMTKRLFGFDVVGEGAMQVSFGFDQSQPAAFTPPWPVPADTVPGQIIPMPLAAPSLSVKLTWDGSTSWQLHAVTLYVQDRPVRR